jgi:hypothetical protein
VTGDARDRGRPEDRPSGGPGAGHADYMGVYTEIEARLRGLETRVGDLDDALTSVPGDPTGAAHAPAHTVTQADHPLDDAEPDDADLAFPTLQAWVEGHFVHLYARPLGGPWRWCPHWWDHAEAIGRLDALWRAWESLRTDPQLGMATWYAQYLDTQLPVLLGSHGPFARCTEERHEPSRPLRTEAVPPGWWEAPA